MRLLSLIAPWRKPSPRRRSRRAIRQAPDWRRRRRIAVGALAAIAVGTLIGLWSNGWIGRRVAQTEAAVLAASARAGLKVGDVLVEGRTRTARSAILNALAIARDVPILDFDPHLAKTRLEALPWVREATVERRLPDTVFVRLVEREPLALWQQGARLTVIDRDGAVIEGAPPEAFAGLALLVGEDAPGHALDLVDMLNREPELRRHVAAAVLVRGRRWNVRLDSGIDVRLPEADPGAAWTELARLEREHGVLERDVITIDMRMKDRLIVRTAPGVTPGRGRSRKGEET
jgi:cell division protein FtsQ